MWILRCDLVLLKLCLGIDFGRANSVVWRPTLVGCLWNFRSIFLQVWLYFLSREMSVLQRRLCRIFDRFLVKRDIDLYWNSCLIGLYLVESVSSIFQFYHNLESSYIYLIILFYEHEFKEILFILDNSEARAVASGHQRMRRPTRSTCELILWNVC